MIRELVWTYFKENLLTFTENKYFFKKV